MQVSDVTAPRLRRLAQMRVEHGRVFSLYLNLDPSQFATPAARSSEIRSLLDEADRRVRTIDDLAHDEHKALRADVRRAREFFDREFSADGAHGLALFSATALDMFEVLKLPRPVASAIAIDAAPFVEPLTQLGALTRWCVVLVSRTLGRILRGDPDRLDEIGRVFDDVHGQHDQGGWSQRRYERSIEHDVDVHLQRVAEAVLQAYKRAPFDHLVIGGPEELCPKFKDQLHPYVGGLLAGRIHADVETSTPEQVLTAATPVIEEAMRRREREALDRLVQGVGAGGRAAAGLEAVLDALTQRRVETLLVEERFCAPGTLCPRCGWLGLAAHDSCPADGTQLIVCENVVDPAMQAAIGQSAELISVRSYPDLGPLGGIGALLRF
jgi:peptide subunit release factor 1 (eRF1)